MQGVAFPDRAMIHMPLYESYAPTQEYTEIFVAVSPKVFEFGEVEIDLFRIFTPDKHTTETLYETRH